MSKVLALQGQPFLGYFASSYLNAEPAASDWICVYDLCLNSSTLGRWDLTAHYSPSLGVTRFGNAWYGIPDRPSRSKPTARQLQHWVDSNWHGCIYEQRARADQRQRAKYERHSYETQQWFRANGANYVFLALRLGAVSFHTKQIIGIHDIWWCLRNKSPSIQDAVIVKIKVGKQREIDNFARCWLDKNPSFKQEGLCK